MNNLLFLKMKMVINIMTLCEKNQLHQIKYHCTIQLTKLASILTN